ncbi:MAG: hypothetical protein JRH20_24715 [Deltaproteobacteria bacterium]|nr:hypothetical protein [Deltaproteobacteria bacterium]
MPGIGFTPGKDEHAAKLRQELINGRSLERGATHVLEGALAELIVNEGALKGKLHVDVQKNGTMEVQQRIGRRTTTFRIKHGARGYKVMRVTPAPVPRGRP